MVEIYKTTIERTRHGNAPVMSNEYHSDAKKSLDKLFD